MKKVYIILAILLGVAVLPLFVYSFFFQQWGTPADWISGIGTILAVVVSLYLANKVEAPHIDFEVGKSSNGDYKIKAKNNARYFVRLEAINISPEYIFVAGHSYNKDIGIPLSPCGTLMLGTEYPKHDPKFVTTITVDQKVKEKYIVLLDRISNKKFKIKLV